MIEIQRRSVQVGGIAVRYQVVGEGEPVVLVHGLSASSRWWVRNVPLLAQHFRVYLVDLPGFGEMRYARRHFALSRMAAWLQEWMAAVGIQQAHLVGHSMGGYICLWVAAERPELVKRLVLVSPAIFEQARSLFSYAFPLLNGTRFMAPNFFPILTYDMVRMGPTTFLRATRELLAQDMAEKVRAICMPTLLVWGEKDMLVPLSIGDALRKQLPHAKFLLLKGGGHISMYDRADEFNREVIAFLHLPESA